jgi:NTP pyrophosphatase (non-canonical NTP hydrolase)
MQLNEYQELAARTRKEMKYEDALAHLALGCCSEAGELATTIKAFLYYGKALDRPNVLEELGDIMWFVSQLADALEMPLDTVARANIEKLRLRYPAKYSDAHALARADKQS